MLWEALDRLRPEYRQVLLHYHFEDGLQQDIACFLGLTLSTVKWRLLRKRQSLKVKFEEVFNLEAARSPRAQQAAAPVGIRRIAFVGASSADSSALGTGLNSYSLWLLRRALPLVICGFVGVGRELDL